MKRLFKMMSAGLVAAALLAGCGSTPSTSVAEEQSAPAPASAPAAVEPVAFSIAGMKGPTTMGMVRLMSQADAGMTAHDYHVEMYGTADEIVPKLVSGELDMAMVPANLAAVLYQNENLDVQVAAINTLGVLYVVETGQEIESVEDLRGRTIYSTGKGTTPEFALNYVLEQNGLDPESDVSIEFRSEATEIAALLAGGEDVVAVLPQPYVTAVGMQNDSLRVALDLSEEWDRVSPDSALVTGVLVARTAFVEENPAAFADFLAEYEASVAWVNANTAEAAELVAEYGIVEAAPVAAAALPYCNIVYIDGVEMQTRLGGYLQVLYNANPASVGGALPEDDFYYLG